MFSCFIPEPKLTCPKSLKEYVDRVNRRQCICLDASDVYDVHFETNETEHGVAGHALKYWLQTPSGPMSVLAIPAEIVHQADYGCVDGWAIVVGGVFVIVFDREWVPGDLSDLDSYFDEIQEILEWH
jgi:hypothetical protein